MLKKRRQTVKTSGKFPKVENFLENVGVFFMVIVITVAIGAAVIFGSKALEFFRTLQFPDFSGLIQIKMPPENNIQKQMPQTGAVTGSFTDIFSGTAWLDMGKTTMHYDPLEAAFTFPPVIEKEPIGSTNVQFSGDQGKYCIREGCLIKNGNAIIVSGSDIALPPELSAVSLENLSVGALDTKWLVGGVVKNVSGTYEGFVFEFDGKIFTPIFGAGGKAGEAITSGSAGILGFGGGDNDYLIIYGGNTGLAYRVVKNNSIYKYENISRFFNDRIMRGGFESGVIKTSDGNWYIFNRSGDKPVFVKLFQNNAGEIAGAVDLTDVAGLSGAKGAIFDVDPENQGYLVAKIIDSSRAAGFFRIKDNGFDKSRGLDVVSSDIYSVPAHPAKIIEARIVSVNLGGGTDVAEFYLSNDGNNWQKAAIGETIKFANQNGTGLFWRVKLSPNNDFRQSVFFDKINITYWLQ